MFKTRLLSGVVLLLALLGMLFAGGEVLLFSLTAIALIGLFGVVFKSKIFQIIEKIYKKEKYNAIDAYKQKN